MRKTQDLIAGARKEFKMKTYMIVFDKEIYQQIDVTDKSEDEIVSLGLKLTQDYDENKILIGVSFQALGRDIDKTIRSYLAKEYGFIGKDKMDTLNFEDWAKAGLITTAQLVEFQTKRQETIKGKNE